MSPIEIIRKRADFVAASRDGVKIGGPLIGLQMRDRGEPGSAPRIGFTATKRVGGAVERNRMKRRMRAAAREALATIAKPGCDYVLIARRAMLDATFDRVLRDVGEAAKRAHGRARTAAEKLPPATPPTPATARRESGR